MDCRAVVGLPHQLTVHVALQQEGLMNLPDGKMGLFYVELLRTQEVDTHFTLEGGNFPADFP